VSFLGIFKNVKIFKLNMMDIDKTNKWFQKINKELYSEYKWKIVAIDSDTGDYFIGDSALEAYNNAIKKYPRKKFVFRRIGFRNAYSLNAS